MPAQAPSPRGDQIVARALRRSLAAIVAIAVAGLAGWWSLSPGRSDDAPLTAGPPALPRRAADVSPPGVPFENVTREAGITFERVSGAEGEKLLPETMGGGAAFLDVDNDGDQDLVLVNGRSWPWGRTVRRPPLLSLYGNDGQGRFTDRTAAAGLTASGYGMGVAAGDYDNDGFVDLFVAEVGGRRLFRNLGGRFVDRTRESGLGGPAGWGTSAAWFDYDNDGDLDLFVCHYVEWSRDLDRRQGFQITGIGRAYGPPRNFAGTFPALFRNDGGRFVDVAAAAGLEVRNPATGVPVAKSLGVAPVDLDRDGCIDLIVANDTVPNFLFRNRCDGTFEELGARAGVAFDAYGLARSAMGIDTGEVGDDGALAVAIGNFSNEMTALYVQRAGDRLLFVDDAISSGIGAPSRRALTFGTVFLDYDLDGRLDLLTANGHLEEQIATVQPGQQYEQAVQLFWNAGADAASTFVLVPEAGALLDPMVGRAATTADIDGDGDLDVLLTPAEGAVRLLRNDQRLGHHWVRLKLVGRRGNRDAIGAIVELHAGGRLQRRQVMPTRGYLSQVELPLTFGLGRTPSVDRVVIRWPLGSVQEVKDVGVDRLTTVEEK